MTLEHLGQTVSVGLLVVDREEVGQVITSRRAEERRHRGDAAPLFPRLLAHLFVHAGGLHPFRSPVGPGGDSVDRAGQVAEGDPVEKASRPDVEDFLDERVRVVDGAGRGGIDSHWRAPALSTIGDTGTASPFRFDDSRAA